jgi:hypothetical protein
MLFPMVGRSFALTDLETGRLVAYALLCAEARYAGVLNRGASMIDRQLTSAFHWLNVEDQLSNRIDAGPLHRSSPIVALLLEADRRSSIIVEHLVSTPLEVRTGDVTATLDAHLREFALEQLT